MEARRDAARDPHPRHRLALEVAGVEDRLIFSASAAEGDPFARPAEERPEAFRMLWDNAARLAPPDAGPQAAPLIAPEAWALVHGLAVLILDGQIPRNDALIDALLAGPPGA